MKENLILPLAFTIVTIFAVGMWGWRRNVALSGYTDKVRGALPSRDEAAMPNQAPAARAQEAQAANAASAAPRKFIDMTARERREILRQIKTTDPDELFELFLNAGRIEQDPMKQSALQGRLTGSLKLKAPSPEFMEKVRRFVMDVSNSKLERGLIISAFAGSRSKEGTEFVLWTVSNHTDPELKQGAINNISGLGGAQPYLPGMIEPLWRESNDPKLLKAVATAMAGEAAPSSIELLLAAVTLSEGQDDEQRMAALWALPQVYRREAVPALASALENTPPGSRMSTVALATLSQIGDKSAAEAVLGWLQAADSRAAPLVASWIGRANSAAHSKAANSALNPSMPFRSEENQEAIRAALAAQRAATTTIGPNK